MKNKHLGFAEYGINLCISSFAIITIVTMILYLPDKVDGMFFNKIIYLYDLKSVIIVAYSVFLFNFRLFSNFIFTNRDFKNYAFAMNKIPLWKKILCIMSLLLILVSVFNINVLKIESDHLEIKQGFFSKTQVVMYSDLEKLDLFEATNNEVYWGKYKENSVVYLNYDVYLGKKHNIDKLIQYINLKSENQFKGI